MRTSRVKSFALAALAAVMASTAVADAGSNRDASFFSSVEGRWRGPGEIVAGKFKGTKFTCDFHGVTPKDLTGMTLQGECRVGMFSQKMEATVSKSGKSYKGRFLDGAAGEGLDVVAGNISGDRGVFTLKRNQLDGAMLVRKANDATLNVTVSVQVDNELVPVIGMSMTRIDDQQVGSIQ